METKKKSDLIRAFVKGGFLSPADLLKIMELSKILAINTFCDEQTVDSIQPTAFACSRRAFNVKEV